MKLKHIVSLLVGCLYYIVSYPTITVEHTKIPFLWGAAVSEYQVSGAATCTQSNWSKWEQQMGLEPSADACQFWDRFEHDIFLMKQLGIQTFRFSVEWCTIEPREGEYNEAALDHYARVIKRLIEEGIEPMITLHHFVHPDWFERKGGFAYEENIPLFVRYCQHVFEAFADQVRLWTVINEPTVFALQGYLRGVYPPGIINPFTAFTVLRTLMQAHVAVYHALKSMPSGDHCSIGFIHQPLKFEPYSSWNPLERIPGWLFNRLTHEAVTDFIKTGVFQAYNLPLLRCYYQAPAGRFYDFIGLNYYSRALIRAQASITEPLYPTHADGQIMTEMPYAMYPEGLYEMLMELKDLTTPIYITENGVADANDTLRKEWIEGYVGATKQAIRDGADVRGYYYWSLLDNYEWDMGYEKKFGLISVDHTTQERTIRPSGLWYAQMISSEDEQ